MSRPLHVAHPEDLDAAAVLRVADGDPLVLEPALLEAVARSRAETLTALASGARVYGVSTGMGSQATLAVGTADQPGFQGDLMLARSVGSAPWLDHRTVRAVLAVRLRTLLAPEAGVSPELVAALAALLDTGLHPAIPATGNGAAGEIIPLAHLGAFLTGQDTGPTGDSVAGTAYTFAAKEGVAFLQGVPVATALAVLVAADVRLLVAQQVAVDRRRGGADPRTTRPLPPGAGPWRRRARHRAGRAAVARRRRAGPADAAGAGVVPGGRTRARAPAAGGRAGSTRPWSAR